jgi:osmotically-inducible protein OsmY
MQSMNRVNFPAVLTNPPRPMAAPQLQGELRVTLDRSSALSRPGNIRVEMDNAVVVLRGKVPNADERRLAEGIIRLSPGVRTVRNELEIE